MLPRFKLSSDARQVDFHQKTLLSDEFGVGMAGLLLEEVFSAPRCVDVSFALNDPAVYQDIQQVGTTAPNYLMWSGEPGSPYYVVECKGCQTAPSSSMNQLRRGLEQVPSIRFGGDVRPVETLVVATCLEPDSTTLYVVDPPSDHSNDSADSDAFGGDEISERTGERSWYIPNHEAFEKRTRLARESHLLKWAGQFHSAFERDQVLEQRSDAPVMPNLAQQTRLTSAGPYVGIVRPFLPELGNERLRLFTGMEYQLFAQTVGEEAAKQLENAAEAKAAFMDERNVSFSRNGTCMIVDGL